MGHNANRAARRLIFESGKVAVVNAEGVNPTPEFRLLGASPVARAARSIGQAAFLCKAVGVLSTEIGAGGW